MKDNLEKEVETYIIQKKDRRGVDWKKLMELKDKLWLNDSQKYFDTEKGVLLKAMEEGILCFPEPGTFCCYVEESNPHPCLEGQRYNFTNREELKEYVKSFFENRWVNFFMQIKD